MDFIDRERQAAKAREEKEQRAREERNNRRQRAREELDKALALGQRYLEESGCMALLKRLKDYLNSQDSGQDAYWAYDQPRVHFDPSAEEVSQDTLSCILTFYWHPGGIQHNFSIHIYRDATLWFSGRTLPYSTKREVKMEEWRKNRSVIDGALQLVFRDPQVWDREFNRRLDEKHGP